MIRVLIVDDDALIHVTLRTIVNWEKLGYTVVQDCSNGNQVLSYLKNHTMYIPYLYMPGNKLRTLTTFLMDYANAQQGSWQTLAAGIVLIMLPTVLIYIFFQRYILAGVAAGAVKE